MIYAFLEFGTIWFWLATLLPFGLLLYCVEAEKSGTALLTIISVAALFVGFGDPGILHWVANHPVEILEYVAGYVAIGIFWGFVKWYFYLLNARDQVVAFKNKWIRENGAIDDLTLVKTGYGTLTQKERFQLDLQTTPLAPKIPTAQNNQGRIIFWMSYWPASAVWTLLNDPFKRVFQFVYNRLGQLFESMAHSMFKDV